MSCLCSRDGLLSLRGRTECLCNISIIFNPCGVFFTFMLPCIVIDTNYPNLFCYKTLHVSGILSAHHQEFSTVHSALVSFMHVFGDRFQAESRWNTVTRNLHETYQCPMLLFVVVVCLFSCRYNPLWLYFHSPVAGFNLVFEVS